jgi:hypothetical protein
MRAFIQVLWIRGFSISWIGCLKCTKTHLKITKKKTLLSKHMNIELVNANYKVLSEEISPGMKQNKLPTVQLFATYFKYYLFWNRVFRAFQILGCQIKDSISVYVNFPLACECWECLKYKY